MGWFLAINNEEAAPVQVFSSHIIFPASHCQQRGSQRSERKKANSTKENKDAKLMPIIFRCYWLDLFLCLTRWWCGFGPSSTFPRRAMKDFWLPLGERIKLRFLVRSSAKEARSWRARRRRQTRTQSKPVRRTSETPFFFSSLLFFASFDLFCISLRGRKKIIGHLKAQKESLPLFWICIRVTPYIIMNNTSISHP